MSLISRARRSLILLLLLHTLLLLLLLCLHLTPVGEELLLLQRVGTERILPELLLLLKRLDQLHIPVGSQVIELLHAT